MKRRDQRIAIMNCLYQYLLTEKTIEDIFDDNLDVDDRKSISFIVETTVNTIENMEDLQKDITDNLTEQWQWDRLGYIERALLLMGAYEIEHTETDKPVIINEIVEIAKVYCDEEASGLLNGVLDKL